MTASATLRAGVTVAGDITIRLAGIDDLRAMEEVGDALFDLPVKPERAREFLADARHHLVLALRAGRIVGMASGLHYVHPDKDPAMFINEVGVLDAYRNRGVGRALVTFLHRHAVDLGCAEAWLATERANVAARKAYAAAGGVEDDEALVLIEFPMPRERADVHDR